MIMAEVGQQIISRRFTLYPLYTFQYLSDRCPRFLFFQSCLNKCIIGYRDRESKIMPLPFFCAAIFEMFSITIARKRISAATCRKFSSVFSFVQV